MDGNQNLVSPEPKRNSRDRLVVPEPLFGWIEKLEKQFPPPPDDEILGENDTYFIRLCRLAKQAYGMIGWTISHEALVAILVSDFLGDGLLEPQFRIPYTLLQQLEAIEASLKLDTTDRRFYRRVEMVAWHLGIKGETPGEETTTLAQWMSCCARRFGMWDSKTKEFTDELRHKLTGGVQETLARIEQKLGCDTPEKRCEVPGVRINALSRIKVVELKIRKRIMDEGKEFPTFLNQITYRRDDDAGYVCQCTSIHFTPIMTRIVTLMTLMGLIPYMKYALPDTESEEENHE